MSVGMRDSFNSARVGNGGESGRRSVPALGPAAIAAVSRARLHFPVGRALRSVLTSSGSPFPAGARVGRPSPSRESRPEEGLKETSGGFLDLLDERLVRRGYFVRFGGRRLLAGSGARSFLAGCGRKAHRLGNPGKRGLLDLDVGDEVARED